MGNVSVIEVSCPHCGAKLKAPEERVGRKAKCKKCGQSFRVPGARPAGESVSEPQALRALTMPIPPLPDDDLTEVMMAEPLPASPPAPKSVPSAPAKDLAALPSADPFDFSKPAAPPPKPAFGAAKASAPPAPAKPQAAKPSKPALEPLPLDDDEPREEIPFGELQPPKNSKAKTKTASAPVPAPAPTNDPFSFGFTDEPAAPEKPKKSRRRDEDEDEDEELEERPRKKKRRDEDEPEGDESDTPRYKRPEEKAGMGKTLLLTGVLGLFALGLAIVAVVVYVNNNRPEEAKKEEKKEEPPAPEPPPPAPIPPKEDPKKPKDKEPKPKDKEPEPKPKEKEPEPKPKEKEPGLTRPAIELGKFRTFGVGTVPAKPERADKPSNQAVIETPDVLVRRVFPPFDPRSSDTFVLVQTSVGGFNGNPEKLSLDAYSPSSGKRVSRLEFNGDGVPNPVCDIHSSTTGVRFLAATGGKITIWTADDSKKLHDAIDPYADKPDHKKAGLAAAFFSPNPDQLVTVSTAGAVHLFDIRTKTAVSEFVPPHGAAGRVVLGQSVARAENGGSVVVAVAGVLYQIKSTPDLERLRMHDIGGDVGKSFGIAVSGTPGRILYSFETDSKGKKDRAVLCLPLGAGAKPIMYLWPAAAGHPKGAIWANDTSAGVIADRGVVWFDGAEEKFVPLVFTLPTVGSYYLGDDHAFWYVVPHPSKPMQSVLVSLKAPFDDVFDYRTNSESGKPLRIVRIDSNGLAK